VSIRREGEVYLLKWDIGGKQGQLGAGILEGRILSVGFADLTGRAFGAGSYRVGSEERLAGRWVCMGGSEPGFETLTWERAD